MRKAWTIAWKDTLIRFRDRNALLINIVAPLLLAGIMGAAFGEFGSNESAIVDIPVIVVDEDGGELSQVFLEAFASEGLDDLLEAIPLDDKDAALKMVEDGEARVVLYIPPGFSSDLMSPEQSDMPVTTLEIYTDPSASVSPVIVRGIVEQIVIGMNQSNISTQVAVNQLTIDYAADLGPKLATLGNAIEATIPTSSENSNNTAVSLDLITVGSEDPDEPVDALAFFAPSMAVFFLMFSMIEGSRSILDEKLAGTLDRLLATPSHAMEVVLGKISGTFMIGILQMVIFIVVSALIFGLNWGNSVAGLALMMVAVVAAATSLGTLLSAFLKEGNQVQIVGTAITLIFAMFGGNFLPAFLLPDFMQPISKLTINRWAIDGFTDLTIGRVGFAGILPEAGVLFAMTFIFFVLGVWQFQRRLTR